MDIDEIDRRLFHLEEYAYREAKATRSDDWRELFDRIKAARLKSFRMLPEKRQKELVG